MLSIAISSSLCCSTLSQIICNVVTIKIDYIAFIILAIAALAFLVGLIVFSFRRIARSLKEINNDSNNHNIDTSGDYETHKRLVDSLPSPVSVYDYNGVCIYANDHSLKLAKVSSFSEIENLFESGNISEENKKKLRSGIECTDIAFLNFNENKSYRVLGKIYNQKSVIQYSVKPIYEPNGSISYYVTILNDITDEYIKKRTLEEYVILLRDCMHISSISAYFYDVEENIYYKLRGDKIERTNLTQETVFNSVAPLFRGEYIEMFLRIKNGEIVTDRRRYPMYASIPQKYYYVETFTYGITDESGNVIRILQTIRNVSEDQKKHMELENLKAILDQTLPVANIKSWVLDIANRVVYITNSATPDTPIPLDDIANTLHPDDKDKFVNAYTRMINGELEEIQHTSLRKDESGKWYMCDFFCIPKRDNNGTLTTLVGISTNITDKHAIQHEYDELVAKGFAHSKLTNTWACDYDCLTHQLSFISKYGINRQADPLALIRLVTHEDRHIFIALLEKVKNQDISEFSCESSIRIQGVTKAISFMCNAYEYNENGKPIKYIGSVKLGQ